jgi:phosphoenolpyruvate-protein kinase (PTS system EI component)
MRKGIPVSPGVAVGKAYCIHEIFVNPDTQRLEDHEITAELANYETARDKAAAELRALQHKVEQQVGHDEAAIFGVHESILRDMAFTSKVRGWIVNDRLKAQAGLARLLDEYTALFARTNDEYLKERLNDLRTAEAASLPANTHAELRRDIARLRVVRDQIKEQQRLQRIEQAAPSEKGPHAMIRLLARVIGIGVETADMLVNEILSRQLRDRKAVARYAGLTGSPARYADQRRS